MLQGSHDAAAVDAVPMHRLAGLLKHKHRLIS